MTDEFVREAEIAFERHDAFERDDDGFVATTTPFGARIRLSEADGAVEYRVTVRVPTINAVVEGEEVARVVREGWFETFELRLEDAHNATRVDPSPPSVEQRDEEVLVESTYETGVASRGVADAQALIQYVEGTFVEGLIPGYEYRDPARAFLDRARERSESAGGPGGTPL